MAEVKNHARVSLDSVVNQDGAVDQFADVRPFFDHAPHPRKPGEQTNMVQKGIAKPGGSIRVVFGKMADDFGEIFQSPLRVEELVIHLGKRWRTSSTDTVRPASAS
jgi:hypothetical protein